MFRVIIDTNVFVAAATTPMGLCDTLMLRWHAGDFEPVVSPRLLAEVERVLFRPKFVDRIDHRRATRYIEFLRHRCVVLPDVGDPPNISRDAEDDYLFALASTGRARVIVTGDKDLLHVIDPPIPVMTPRAFLESLGRSGGA